MEKEIDELLEGLIKEKVESYVTEGLITKRIDIIIKDVLKEKIVNYFNLVSATTDFFKDKINEILNQPIKVDNGWGDRKTYSSFEELFKTTLKEKIDSDYTISNTVKECVKNRIDKLIETKANELMKEVEKQVILELEKGVK